MNVDDTWRKVVNQLSELEEWDDEKLQWKDTFWVERTKWSYERFTRALPRAEQQGFRLTTTALYAIPNIGEFIERLIDPFLNQKTIMFKNLRHRLRENLASTRIPPSQHKGTPEQIVRTYLRHTPLRRL